MLLAKRSPSEWSFRVFLALIAVMLAYQSVTGTLAAVLRSKAPKRAYTLAPSDGRIGGTWSAHLSGPDATAAQRTVADDVARSALLYDATAVPAVATLGLNAQIRGDTDGARRIFAYSLRLSRRDFRTQLWAIEDAVGRNDIPAALYQYDIALRTARGGVELLFPILASALDDADIRKELVRTLATGTPWGNDFVIYAAAMSPSPAAVAELLSAMKETGTSVPESAQQRVIDGLLGSGDLEAAWSYYASIRPGTGRGGSRDWRFSGGYVAPSQFDWMVIYAEGATSSIQAGPRGGQFDFVVSATTQGSLLQQVQLLPPGEYILEGQASGFETPNRTLPYWLLSCRDGQEIGRVEMLINGSFAGTMRVPATGCASQVLSLVARLSDSASDVVGQITRVRLRPSV